MTSTPTWMDVLGPAGEAGPSIHSAALPPSSAAGDTEVSAHG